MNLTTEIIGGKYLISTDNWFFAPNGKQYNAVWGDVKIVSDAILGIKTNMRSTNWFAKVGTEKNHVIIAGCQIHYAVRCEEVPDMNDIEDYRVTDKGCEKFTRPTRIYITEQL